MSVTKQLRRFHYLDCDEGQIHYWTAGRGPNLILLHSSGNSSEEFAAIVPFLSEHFRMIAIDLPGHGRTYNPHVQLRVEDNAAAARAVLDELEVKKSHIVSHHGGALSTMSLVAAEPDRFDKVILSGVDEEYELEAKQALIDRVKNTDTTVTSDGKFMSSTWIRYQSMLSDGAKPDQILKPFLAFLDARLRPFRGILTNLNWDRKETIAKLKGPMLIVAGTNDSYIVKQERLLSLIPNSEYLEMPGCGTFMFYDYAENCAKMILKYIKPLS